MQWWSRRRASLAGAVWYLPALAMYAAFVLLPLAMTCWYSLYRWDGIGSSLFVGFENYRKVLVEEELRTSLMNAFVLVIFFSFIPILLALLIAAILKDVRSPRILAVSRGILFVPQVLPLVASGIAWTMMYSSSGLVNGILGWLGLSALQNDWLGDFTTALPAVGIIGSWVSLGFCVVLVSAGIGRIPGELYEAAALDGANWMARFRHVTVPGVRNEIKICLTMTIISALSSFDLVYVSTGGGPGYSTVVPGLEIYRLVFVDNRVGEGSALAVVLAVLIFAVVGILQKLGSTKDV